MTQFLFDDRLIDQVQNMKGQAAKRPLTKWSVAPVKIGNQIFYLYVEETTGMPLFADQLGEARFTLLCSELFDGLGFLTDKQHDWLYNNIAGGTCSYRYSPKLTNQLLSKYENFIKKHQKEFALAARQNDEVPLNQTLFGLTVMLLREMNLFDEVLERFAQTINHLKPQKANKPRSNVKYILAQPQFSDPRIWQDSEKEEITDSEVITNVLQNNQKMITQFLMSQQDDFLDDRQQSKQILQDFLDNFLLKHCGQVVTTNLALSRLYLACIIDKKFDISTAKMTLILFYQFLSQVGIITRSNAETEIDELDDDFYIMEYQSLPLDKDSLKQLLDAHVQDSEFLSRIERLIKNGGLPVAYQEMVTKASQQRKSLFSNEYSNPSRIDQFYHLHGELVGFSPKMTRDFVIRGDQSIAEMAELLIVMFNGELYHMYDVENKSANVIYRIQDEDMEDLFSEIDNVKIVDAEEATVSLLKTDDELRVHYDFGDDWEFKLTVKNVAEHDQLWTPRVTDAVGYGIIEDIGGVSGLAKYYREFKSGDIDPYMREQFGDHLIDLRDADNERINNMIKGYLGTRGW